MVDPSLYTVGGTVQANERGIYLSRQADRELLALCEDSTFAYVLTPRQMGKSSLMIRTAEQLIDAGKQAVIVDLTQLGTQLSADEWYSDFLDLVASQLMLTTDVKQWWRANHQSGLTLRLTRFFQDVVLAEVAEPIVIFVDEIDTTLSLDFTDDFYAAIRYLYVARSTDSRLRRLSFVLIGVATPADLIQDPKRTPFNIGQRVDLTDFSAEEALPLAAGLGLVPEKEQQMLEGVLQWTGGHPYLTQRLCRALADKPPQGWTAAAVEPVVAETFFGRMSEQDNNLQFVRDMLTKRAPASLEQEVLTTYREIYRDRRPVLDEEQNLVKSHLKLSGVVRREGKQLQVRNRIYREVFSQEWIREHLPENFWQRYKPVLKWAIPVTAASVLSAGVMAGLAQDARESAQEAKQQKAIAEEQTVIARQKAQEAEQNAQEAKRQTTIAEGQKKLALENEAKTEEALNKEQEANEQRAIALTAAETQQQRAEEQANIAQQQRERAENQAIIAQAQTRRAETQTALAEQQTKLAEQQTRVAQLREQVARVLNLLPTTNAVSGLVLAIDTMAQSQSVPSVALTGQASLLKAVQVSQEINRLAGHGAAVLSVAFSPDGQRIVSGSFDNTLRLWDANTGAPIGEPLAGHGDAVWSVAFSPDGQRIVSGSFDNTLRLWDANTGAPIGEPLAGHGDAVWSVAFSPDGQRIVSGSFDNTLRLWDANTGAPIG
ncbi:AAA-like domain-containing protein, partial [Leptothoe sp. PORK10 BA2]|uniref:AAA-like domain-containing protein n=1 Tax=Leptothoe sp. PORK10 BA2 TaxID=3110254 RepID=UPI002B20027C